MSSQSSQLMQEFSKREIVRAGAGAGKTTTLIAKILGFAKGFHQENGRFPKVGVTTFTRKATQEIRERLMKKCVEEEPELLDFVTSSSYLHISTIHGFLNLFLQKYGKKIDLDPNFEIVDERQQDLLFKENLKEILFESLEGAELLEKYSFETLLEFSKTYFNLWISNRDIQSHDIESLSELYFFYLSKVAEKINAVSSLVLQQTDDEKWIDFAKSLKTLNASLQNKTDLEKRIEISNYLERVSKPRHMKKNPKVSDEVALQVADLWDSLKEMASDRIEDSHWDPRLWPEFIENYQKFQKSMTAFCSLFFEKKMEKGFLTISDLETLTLLLLKREEDCAQAFSEEWNYWLIDEYQDTSPVQVEILEKMVGKSSCFLVGDPQQSIYLFRGARSEVFSQKEEEFKKANEICSVKMKNYRSQPELLLFFNEFFQSMSQQFASMEPREEVKAEKELPTVAHFSIAMEETDESGTSQEFQSIHANIVGLMEKGIRSDQICIIGRTNKQLDQLARYLTEQGHDVHVHISSGYFERREIKDACQILKFFVNPHDDLNLLSLLRSPWFHVEDEILAQWGRRRREYSSYWKTLESISLEEWPYRLVELKKLREESLEFGYAHVFEKALIDSGLLLSSHELDPTGRRESNLWKLVSLLREGERRPGFSILEFVDSSQTSMDLDAGSGEGDAVAFVEPHRINMMTVHSSKGLEFDYVFIPWLDKAPLLSKKQGFSFDEKRNKWSIPLMNQKEQRSMYSLADYHVTQVFREAELEEEERLFYVAMTRAKKAVFLSWKGKIQKGSLASRFMGRSFGDFETAEKKVKSDYSYIVDRGPWEAPKLEKSLESTSHLPEALNIAPTEQIDKNQWSKTSVSQILNSVYENEENTQKNSSSIEDANQRMYRAHMGSLIHEMLERVKNGGDFEKLSEKWLENQKEDVVEAFKYVQSILELPLKEIMENGFAEWGFQASFSGKIIEGQIDLWGEVVRKSGKEIWVIDYKTGSSFFSDKAFQQLSIYAKILQKRFPGHEFHLATIFPFEKKVKIKKMKEMSQFIESTFTLWN